MPRGGKRTATDGKKLGRPKVARATTPSIAAKVLNDIRVEQKWKQIIEIETTNAETKFTTAGLRETLKYLENRAYGNCTDTVNHLHDKPIEHTVTVTIAEVIRKVRERKEQYERSR